MLYRRHHTPATKKHARVLFVLKFRATPYTESYETWGDTSSKPLHNGLYNSARMVCEMLDENGVEAKLVHVADNNAIHKEIVAYKPTHVIIEAFWVVPEKFDELRRACPHVQFIVRNHSETPFLANEGIAFDWTLGYAERDGVAISCNAPRMLEETRFLVSTHQPDLTEEQIETKVPFLPNYYPTPDGDTHRPLRRRDTLEIGCFGAVRPLKNHMLQAIAALSFAEQHGQSLNFNINATRVEMQGSPVLKNLRQLFDRFPNHNLVEHGWLDHADFRKLVATMDMVMQVSFSETFNIVAADAVSQGVATVVSAEVPWAAEPFRADPTSSADIARAMRQAWKFKEVAPHFNPSLQGLRRYNDASKAQWLGYFGAEVHR